MDQIGPCEHGPGYLLSLFLPLALGCMWVWL